MRYLLAALSLFSMLSACSRHTTLYVEGGDIFTAAGEPFVMRGFNEMFVWSDDKHGELLLPEIAKSGANTVRLVWSHKHSDYSDLSTLIQNTIALDMVAVPECHDATGKWGAALQACVDFWKESSLLSTIETNKEWTILNIANEAGATISDTDFTETYKAAITELRDFGYTVPIMIDASLWGQDIDQLLRTGPSLLNHDPLKNIIFSAHSYWPHEKSIDNYKKAAIDAKELGIAVIIGEGPSVTRVGQCSKPKPLPYLEGMKILQEHNVGWLNWSWGGKPNGDCTDYRYFDLTINGMYGAWSHEPGAQIVVLSPYSVAKTSKRPASFFDKGKVTASGIYLHLENDYLKKGQSTSFEVIVTPLNASITDYEISSTDNKSIIDIDEKTNTIFAKESGKVSIIVKTTSGKLSWRRDITIAQ